MSNVVIFPENTSLNKPRGQKASTEVLEINPCDREAGQEALAACIGRHGTVRYKGITLANGIDS